MNIKKFVVLLFVIIVYIGYVIGIAYFDSSIGYVLSILTILCFATLLHKLKKKWDNNNLVGNQRKG